MRSVCSCHDRTQRQTNKKKEDQQQILIFGCVQTGGGDTHCELRGVLTNGFINTKRTESQTENGPETTATSTTTTTTTAAATATNSAKATTNGGDPLYLY